MTAAVLDAPAADRPTAADLPAAAQPGSAEHRGWTAWIIAGMAAEPWLRPDPRDMRPSEHEMEENPALAGVASVADHMMRMVHCLAPHVAALCPLDDLRAGSAVVAWAQVPATLCAHAARVAAGCAAEVAASAAHAWEAILDEVIEQAGGRWPDALDGLARMGEPA